ncbi:alpha/beta hydrolase [Nesterenkonia marinintestina]|uniref:alpha/beta hydrolase n=1 Tax=Nesterenkonia marinintestina TaxID=2979865 RepID=UPI0021BF4AA4|nr:alpha/beta hydrolase [Nesterenkonia sp. GX14115]
MILPEKVVRAAVRARGSNRSFLTAEAARERMEALALRPRSWGPPRGLRSDVGITVTRRRGWPLYTVSPTTARAHGAVVYAHGGGWISEIIAEHWRLIAQIAAEAGTTVVVPIYPLAPFGEAEEVVAQFVDILRETADRFGSARLAGDSAGGQIALSAALELRDRHGARVPRTVLISPALDLTWSNPRIPEVQPDDPWLAVPGGHVRTEAWRGDLDVTDQRVSPLFGDPTDLGPITLFSGTHDILNPDARLLAERADEAGVDVELHEGEGLLHVYPLLPTASGARARRTIVERLVDDVRR